MEYKDVPDLRQYIKEWAEEIELFRQILLLDEAQLLSFADERGLPVHGVVTGEPGDLFRRGWLDADETDQAGSPRFHPFRLYPLRQILHACTLRIAPAVSLKPDSAVRVTRRALDR